MPRHDDTVSMRQMLDHAREAIAFATGRSRADLDADRALQLILTRLTEIIGEAGRRVSIATRNRHPQVPWSDIVGMRDRIIHGYDKVDHDILWEVASKDLPTLVRELESILGL